MIELLWEQITTKDGIQYRITSTKDRSEYFLYEMIGGKPKKLGMNSNPKVLESRYVK